MRILARSECTILFIYMNENWKKSVDSGKTFVTLLIHLSKAFNCVSRDLIFAKLNAYGFILLSLRLTHSCFSNRKQMTKMNSAYSFWEEILFIIPQGFILELLLFNIFTCDVFCYIDFEHTFC